MLYASSWYNANWACHILFLLMDGEWLDSCPLLELILLILASTGLRLTKVIENSFSLNWQGIQLWSFSLLIFFIISVPIFILAYNISLTKWNKYLVKDCLTRVHYRQQHVPEVLGIVKFRVSGSKVTQSSGHLLQ